MSPPTAPDMENTSPPLSQSEEVSVLGQLSLPWYQPDLPLSSPTPGTGGLNTLCGEALLGGNKTTVPVPFTPPGETRMETEGCGQEAGKGIKKDVAEDSVGW